MYQQYNFQIEPSFLWGGSHRRKLLKDLSGEENPGVAWVPQTNKSEYSFFSECLLFIGAWAKSREGAKCTEPRPVAQDSPSRRPALEHRQPCPLLLPKYERIRCGVTGTLWMLVALEEGNLCWNYPFSNKEATLVSEIWWRQHVCLEKLSRGVASPLLSKFALIKIETAVTGHINFPNRFSLISRLCFCGSAPDASTLVLAWMPGRAACVQASLGRRGDATQDHGGQDREPSGLSWTRGGGQREIQEGFLCSNLPTGSWASHDILLGWYYLPFERLSEKGFSFSFLSTHSVFRERLQPPRPPRDRLPLRRVTCGWG